MKNVIYPWRMRKSCNLTGTGGREWKGEKESGGCSSLKPTVIAETRYLWINPKHVFLAEFAWLYMYLYVVLTCRVKNFDNHKQLLNLTVIRKRFYYFQPFKFLFITRYCSQRLNLCGNCACGAWTRVLAVFKLLEWSCTCSPVHSAVQQL